jgi:heme/copper-type cytochrome/quinol oxidase subunit 3
MLALLASGAALHRARRHLVPAEGRRHRRYTLAALVLMAIFLASLLQSLSEYGVPPQRHALASLVGTLSGFAGLHAAIALVMAAFAWMRSRRGLSDARRPAALQVVWLFWSFTVGVGVLTSAVVHLSPRLL